MKYLGHIEDIAVDEVTPRDVLIADETSAGVGAPVETLPGAECLDSDGLTARQREIAVRGVGNFAAANPEKWWTYDASLRHPHDTHKQLAARLGISERSVRRHLKEFEEKCRSMRNEASS